MLIAIILLSVLTAVILSALFWAYHKVFYSPKKDMSETVSPHILSDDRFRDVVCGNIEDLSRIPCEFCTTRSFDHLKLSARYYKGDADKPLCLCFHGYRGSALRDYSGIGLFLIREGYNVMIVDERAHWRSQGHTISFGINERYDVLSWIAYAGERFSDIPVYLFGISMGGGAVLMASGLKLPGSVRGIVADCPFNSAKDVIRHVCRKIRLNPDLCWPLIWASARVYGRFNINATTAAQAVKSTTAPVLIIHGEGDDFVPARMSKEIGDANPGMTERHTIAKADHGMSYYYDTQRYEAIVKDFLKKNP